MLKCVHTPKYNCLYICVCKESSALRPSRVISIPQFYVSQNISVDANIQVCNACTKIPEKIKSVICSRMQTVLRAEDLRNYEKLFLCENWMTWKSPKCSVQILIAVGPVGPKYLANMHFTDSALKVWVLWSSGLGYETCVTQNTTIEISKIIFYEDLERIFDDFRSCHMTARLNFNWRRDDVSNDQFETRVCI